MQRLRPVDLEPTQRAGGLFGEMLLPLQDAKIFYANQYVALVAAETYEQARYGAQLVKVRYDETKPSIDYEHKEIVEPASSRGKQQIVGEPVNAFDSAAANSFRLTRSKPNSLTRWIPTRRSRSVNCETNAYGPNLENNSTIRD